MIPANGCNRGTFVLAVCSCCSFDGVISAHFLITTLPGAVTETGCLSVPGKHNEKQRNCEETQEKATLSRRIENQSERAISWLGQECSRDLCKVTLELVLVMLAGITRN